MNGLVEGRDVLVGRVFIERRGKAVAHLGERLGSELDELLKAAEELLCVLAVRTVIGALRLVDSG